MLGDSFEYSLIRFTKTFGLLDYIKLKIYAFGVLCDSGTITEEVSLINLPAIALRNTHERPEGMDAGTLIMSGLKKDSVLAAVKVVTSQHQADRRVIPIVSVYQGGPVSTRVVRVALSYTDYVMRNVWRKS